MEPVNFLYSLLSSRTENGARVARGEACQTFMGIQLLGYLYVGGRNALLNLLEY